MGEGGTNIRRVGDKPVTIVAETENKKERPWDRRVLPGKRGEGVVLNLVPMKRPRRGIIAPRRNEVNAECCREKKLRAGLDPDSM